MNAKITLSVRRAFTAKPLDRLNESWLRDTLILEKGGRLLFAATYKWGEPRATEIKTREKAKT